MISNITPLTSTIDIKFSPKISFSQSLHHRWVGSWCLHFSQSLEHRFTKFFLCLRLCIIWILLCYVSTQVLCYTFRFQLHPCSTICTNITNGNDFNSKILFLMKNSGKGRILILGLWWYSGFWYVFVSQIVVVEWEVKSNPLHFANT